MKQPTFVFPESQYSSKRLARLLQGLAGTIISKFWKSRRISCLILIPSRIPCFRGTTVFSKLPYHNQPFLDFVRTSRSFQWKPFCLNQPELASFLISTRNCVYKYSVTKVTESGYTFSFLKAQLWDIYKKFLPVTKCTKKRRDWGLILAWYSLITLWSLTFVWALIYKKRWPCNQLLYRGLCVIYITLMVFPLF